jgi:hypothetical protein
MKRVIGMNHGMGNIIFTLVLAVCMACLPKSIAWGAEIEAEEGEQNYLAYVRGNTSEGAIRTYSLMLAKVLPDGFEEREVFVEEKFGMFWQPLTVVRGKLYGMNIDLLVSIDVQTSKAEQICDKIENYTFQDGRLYGIVGVRGQGQVLRVFDFAAEAQRDVCEVETNSSFSRREVAVSRDGTRLAFFMGEGNDMAPLGNRLHIVDLKEGKDMIVGETVYARIFMTGAGDFSPGPAFAWLNAGTTLMVYDVVHRDGPDAGSLTLPYGAESLLATMDTVTGKVTDLLELPEWYRQLSDLYFVEQPDGAMPRIMLGELGQYRIDLENKRLMKDDVIGGNFRLIHSRRRQRLMAGKKELSFESRIPVAVSHSGKRAAWVTNPQGRSTLCFYDVSEGSMRVIAEGYFPPPAFKRNSSGCLLWLSESDLKKEKRPQTGTGWAEFSTTPYPPPPRPKRVDKRKDIADYITMTLSTDRQKYRLHEPVALTATLIAKEGKEMTFPQPDEYDRWFRLGMKGPRSSSMIDSFERTHEIFGGKEVIIKSGQDFVHTGILEPHTEGVWEIDGKLYVSNEDWKGEVEVEPITFLVESSADDEQLLKEKFDRMMSSFREKYERDPGNAGFLDIDKLGDGAVPLLVAEIRACEDSRLRNRMSDELAQFATGEALPYYRERLATDMEEDHMQILDGLMRMTRGQWQDEAIELLLKALEHPNRSVRHGAADRLSGMNDAQVRGGFEKAVRDSDVMIATTAACYLAKHEGLPPADWMAKAAAEPTLARYLAAQSFVRDSERRWRLGIGQMPGTPWADFRDSAEQLEQYRVTLAGWERWARENPRSAANLFDGEHQY